MEKQQLFVDKIIEIDAPAKKVWEALTKREHTDEWAKEFSSGPSNSSGQGPQFHIESKWKMGSPVEWKDNDGKVIVEGNVTKIEPYSFLRYTVFDTRSERPKVTETDGITFELTELKGTTLLRVIQGDFSSIPDGNGKKYRDMSEKIWDKVLPKIKELAEK